MLNILPVFNTEAQTPLSLSNCLSSILGKQKPEITVYMANEVLLLHTIRQGSGGGVGCIRDQGEKERQVVISKNVWPDTPFSLAWLVADM